jgi:glutathionyl-hydroquinone reductase
MLWGWLVVAASSFQRPRFQGQEFLYDNPDPLTDTERYASAMGGDGLFGSGRPTQRFRSWLSEDPGARYPGCEEGRYRLYVSYACPWASRTLAVRNMKDLHHIGVFVTDFSLPNLDAPEKYRGWSMHGEPNGYEFIGDLYDAAQPGYTGFYRAKNKRPPLVVPVLYDARRNEIVSTESSDIIRMFNRLSCGTGPDLEPGEARKCMQDTDSVVYPNINDGVYRMGFASEQREYEEQYTKHWEAMDAMEERLASSDYLCGRNVTLSDIRLFMTLVRYDPVYYGHFKGSRNLVAEMPNLNRFTSRMMEFPSIASTVNMTHIVRHYYGSQLRLNPSGIYPVGYLDER